MDQDHISYVSYLGGGILFAALCLVFAFLALRRNLHSALIPAAAGTGVAYLLLALHYHGDIALQPQWLLVAEIIQHGLWISALLLCLRSVRDQGLPPLIRTGMHGLWLLALVAALTLILNDHPLASDGTILIWAGLLLSILGLVAMEQLYRNTDHERMIKLLCVGVGTLVIYDTFIFSHALIFNRIDPDLWQARGAVGGLAALLMAVGALAISGQPAHEARLTMSRPVVFYTTSLTAAGSFLALMALGGYYVHLYGGRWGTVMQITVLALALIAIAVVFISRTVRSHVNVWINKHFFRHKYDYRVEWLRLINDLSRPVDHADFHERAVRAVASIFKSPGGGLWLREHDHFAPVCVFGLELPAEASVNEPAGTPFCTALREHEWVFSPYSPENDKLSAFNNLLPQWIYHLPDLWLILPLLTETELLGFVVLREPEHDTSLTWEDLDLLKTVGRQVASYVDRHDAAELLAESRQFDAFNKLAAFIMHDLKNLIAQQALVVDNAAKHRENPAFFEDAIKTIDNSVSRMSILLRKLQQNEPSELRSLELHKVLMEAVKKCKDNRPAPSLRLEDTHLRVNADQDRLIMTLIHVIKNAQEATDSGGFVDVTLRGQGNSAIITIEDNGMGMDNDFIRNHLFKPFVTTKSGKGMGIGVYQTREFISSIGGSVAVDSMLGEGTTFTITLPVTQG